MPGPVDYEKITIAPDPDVAVWWDATKEKKFLLPECQDCGHKWWPPWPACSACASMNVGWHEIEGTGFVYSYISVEQPILGHMVTAVPYVVAIVELPDGTNADGSKTRISALMLDDEADVAIGLPVKLEWDDHPTQEYKMPRWRVTDKSAPGAWHFSW
jgi:hypothetical protein